MQNEEGEGLSPFFIPHSSFCIRKEGVTDGARTRDVQDHNLALYQLSYGHRVFGEAANMRCSARTVNADARRGTDRVAYRIYHRPL